MSSGIFRIGIFSGSAELVFNSAAFFGERTRLRRPLRVAAAKRRRYADDPGVRSATVNVDPTPGRLTHSIEPPRARAMELASFRSSSTTGMRVVDLARSLTETEGVAPGLVKIDGVEMG